MYLPLVPQKHIIPIFQTLTDIPDMVPALTVFTNLSHTSVPNGLRAPFLPSGDWSVFQQTMTLKDSITAWTIVASVLRSLYTCCITCCTARPSLFPCKPSLFPYSGRIWPGSSDLVLPILPHTFQAVLIVHQRHRVRSWLTNAHVYLPLNSYTNWPLHTCVWSE